MLQKLSVKLNLILLLCFLMPISNPSCTHSKVSIQNNVIGPNSYPSGIVDDIAVNQAGTIYVLGHARVGTVIGNTEFDSGQIAIQDSESAFEKYPFLAEFDNNNNLTSLVSLIELTGNSEYIPLVLELVFNNNIIIGGVDEETNAVIILLLDHDNNIEWARYWEGGHNDIITDICSDSLGNVFLVGQTCPVKSPPFDDQVFGDPDAFILKYDQTGNLLFEKVWGNYETTEAANGVTAGSDNSVYVCGSFRNVLNIFDGGNTVELASRGGDDCYVIKFGGEGELMWAKSWGGGGNDYFVDIMAGGDGRIYTGGVFKGSLVISDSGIPAVNTATGNGNAYVLDISTEGEVQNIKAIGTSERYAALELRVDNNANVYIGGYVESENVIYEPNITVGPDQYFVMALNPDMSYRSVYATNLELKLFSLICFGDQSVLVGADFRESGNIFDYVVSNQTGQTEAENAMILRLLF